MTKSLGKSVINLHSNIACSAVGVGDQQDLNNDLECHPFLRAWLNYNAMFYKTLIEKK